MHRIPTGSPELDNLLSGGYESDTITTIYGPAGSGKTNLCLMAACKAASDKKVIFVDADGGLSVERLKQIDGSYEKILENMMILKPTTFSEQRHAIAQLKKNVSPNTGLIIVDTVVTLYRVERAKSTMYEIMRELGLQVSDLSEIARKKDIPVLLTSQVYGKDDSVHIIRGDLLRYVSKCLIMLENLNNSKKLTLEKHRSIPRKNLVYRIVDSGITPL